MPSEDDPYIGFSANNFTVTKRLGVGAVGSVYLFERKGGLPVMRAIKFIPRCNIRDQWENEIRKVIQLGNTEGVVKYVDHGFTEIAGGQNLWIVWDYIPGRSLRAFIESKTITVPILRDVITRVLQVLHACHEIGIQHADLHAGNILVEDINAVAFDGRQQRIWITDFGYCTASAGKELLDDFLGLGRIIQDALHVINFHDLSGRDKVVFSVLKSSFPKYLSEADPTQGEFSRTPRALLAKLTELISDHVRTKQSGRQRISDYLAAELIGDRFDEWKALFVPEFIGDSTLLDRNICVLTGLRGCGKTMIFRRMTALYDLHLGPSNVPESDSFLGFYVNARVIAEAFPWLPEPSEHQARNQVLHYFHSCWILEVLEWMRTLNRQTKRKDSLSWLLDFFRESFDSRISVTRSDGDVIEHLISFFDRELEKSRLHSAYRLEISELADIAFLDKFVGLISVNMSDVVAGRPFYLFLDDYSLPLVNEPTQRILNSVVFKRSSVAIFKIATESVESFQPIGLNGKPLEEGDDYSLIDSGTVSLLREGNENQRIIEAILGPRIEREPLFRDRKLTLEDILGDPRVTNVSLAEDILSKRKVVYYGRTMFGLMWSSNVREIISLFAKTVGVESKERLNAAPIPGEGLVSQKTQGKIFRDVGGEFLSLLTAATNPSSKLYEVLPGDRSFGEHLVKIAEAFQRIASFELMNKRSKNGPNTPPKQARRIEITNIGSETPDQEISDWYRGIIRYGLFIRDNRGKSVRGQIVPRLVLRGVLVPYCTLTFSLRDNIQMSWDGFCSFLRDPGQYADNWIRNSGSEHAPRVKDLGSQVTKGNGPQGELFDGGSK
jgi:serine/threonine protein kinase